MNYNWSWNVIVIIVVIPIVAMTLVAGWCLGRTAIDFSQAAAKIRMVTTRIRTATTFAGGMFGSLLVHGPPSLGLRMVNGWSDLCLTWVKTVAACC